MKKKYEKLKNVYPEYVSLEQLYKICHIAKTSARYLVQHEIIPAIDTGKKTRRYKIAITDVIDYLRRREQHGSMIPHGALPSKPSCSKDTRPSFSMLVKSGCEKEVGRYFEQVYASSDDILTAPEVAKMTGLHYETILDLLRSGELKSISSSPHYIIPKVFLFDFVVTSRYISMKSMSQAFINVYNSFAVWKATNKFIA